MTTITLTDAVPAPQKTAMFSFPVTQANSEPETP